METILDQRHHSCASPTFHSITCQEKLAPGTRPLALPHLMESTAISSHHVQLIESCPRPRASPQDFIVPCVKYAMDYRPTDSFSMSFTSSKVIFPGVEGSMLPWTSKDSLNQRELLVLATVPVLDQASSIGLCGNGLTP